MTNVLSNGTMCRSVGWGDISVDKWLAVQLRRPELEPQVRSRARQCVLVILVSRSRNRYLELTHQPTYPDEQALDGLNLKKNQGGWLLRNHIQG